MARILVTDGERRSSLAVVRSLGKAGHEVHVLSYGGRSLAGASRHCRAEHRVPDPARSASAHEEAVDRLVARRDIEVVVPTTDASAFLVPGLRREHPHVTVVFPAYEAYREASDKRRVLELASELGIPTPRQIVLERRAFHERGAPRHLDRLGYPLVLKPHRSVVRARDRIVQVAVRGARSRAELGGVLGGFPAPAWPILAQERIAGAGLGVFLLVHRGRTVAAFAHRRLREKPPTG
ncbi:MAG TPA: hypothetical protein VFQ22_03575, partial [Longimicrobiales bacterium]|nr:hypothetical protein [Longimicrobiales bacterium]